MLRRCRQYNPWDVYHKMKLNWFYFIARLTKKHFLQFLDEFNQFYDLNWRPHRNKKWFYKYFLLLTFNFYCSTIQDITRNRIKSDGRYEVKIGIVKTTTLDRRLKLLLPHHFTLPEAIQPVSVSPSSEFQFKIIRLLFCAYSNIFFVVTGLLAAQVSLDLTDEMLIMVYSSL